MPTNRPDRVLAGEVRTGHASGDEYDTPHRAVEHGRSTSQSRTPLWFGTNIGALLLGADRHDHVAPLPDFVEDPHPAVLFKDPREVGWHFLEDA